MIVIRDKRDDIFNFNFKVIFVYNIDIFNVINVVTYGVIDKINRKNIAIDTSSNIDVENVIKDKINKKVNVIAEENKKGLTGLICFVRICSCSLILLK